MDYYRIIVFDGREWKAVEHVFCPKESAIYKARDIYNSGSYENVAVELDNDTKPGSNRKSMVYAVKGWN
ncbi:MAG: hypothetical protein IJ593_06230 [Lachnospiraceae bacterium]|nr:hypothetical protein [Lachnospiraceae bacterium]